MGNVLVATVGTQEGRVLRVVRQPFAVTLTDHPDLDVNAGWTMRVDQARELAEALMNTTSVS
jgi:hypothetical protein